MQTLLEIAATVTLFCLFVALGRFLSPMFWLAKEGSADGEQPSESRSLARPDGTVLHIEICGPRDGPPIILTHGAGGDMSEWTYLRNEFAGACRLITWDLPGMGRSSPAVNQDYSMARLAADLNAVIDLADGGPAVLAGHSIGGMIILEFCRQFPGRLQLRVAGIVMAHTTPTRPSRTLWPTWLMPRLQYVLLEPLAHLAIAAPRFTSLFFNVCYRSGLAHWWAHLFLFAGTESREQLEFTARFFLKARVAELARMTLAMFRFDARDVLAHIDTPMLVVAGQGDLTTVAAASRQIADAVKNAELIVLAPARHLGIIERHEQFSHALWCFFTRLSREQQLWVITPRLGALNDPV